MRNLKSVSEFARLSSFTEAQVRWWIFNESTNGIQKMGVTIRIGRRVYIDVDAFDRWLSEQNAQGGVK